MGSSITEAVPPAVRRKPPTSYQACAPCQVDLGHNMDARAGLWHVLLPLPDCGHLQPQNLHERESADLAAALIRQAVLIARPLVLHADNGSPMKGATMKVTMEKLGITASYSRPRVNGSLAPANIARTDQFVESRCASLGKILRQLV